VIQIKEAVDNGSLTKADVLAFEQNAGMDIDSLSGMMTGGAGGRQLDMRQLRQANPKLAEMVELFQRLSEIKNR